jgi:hypothetical protein
MSDFAVGTLIARPNLNIVGQADDTGHALCGALGIEFLKKGMDEAAERDDAVLYGDTDLSSIDAGLPFELPLDIATNVLVRTHGWSPILHM